MSHRGLSAQERSELLNRNQEELLQDLEYCNRTYRWLEVREKRKTINANCSSYGLKAIAEKEVGGYMTNGAFIAAAIFLGFEFESVPGSPNVCFNISEKSLKNPMFASS